MININRFGLIGKNIGYSYSAIIHKMIGKYPYDILDISEDKFENLLNSEDYKGFNITIPYKKKAFELAISDEVANIIGSINTIVKRDNNIYGYNTDYLGFSYLLDVNKVTVSNQKALLLGSGGAAQSIIYSLIERGISKIYIATRNINKCQLTLNQNYLNNNSHIIELIDYTTISKNTDIKNIDVIINSTPIGNNIKDIPLIDVAYFDNCHTVIDLIYSPYRTKLLIESMALDKKAISGLSMLVYQAVIASMYFGSNTKLNKNIYLPEDSIGLNKIAKDILIDMLWQTQNIVLIGMSLNGKTVLGKELAIKLNKSFIDTDELIEKKFNMSISKIFQIHGEEGFRKIESYVLEQILTQKSLYGKIISTGGGIVMNKYNRDLLLSNSLIINVSRHKSLISTKDISTRPLLANNNYDKIYSTRKNIYDKLSHINIKNDNSINEITNKIIEKVGVYYEKNYFN